jgi:DNA-directed RNA polymerase specialized sigma subunit
MFTSKAREQYQTNLQLLKQLEQQLDELDGALIKIGRYGVNPPIPPRSHDQVGDLVVKITKLRERYSQAWDAAIDYRAGVEAAISGLTGIEQVIMRARYIEGKRWKVIADEFSYSIQHIWDLHGRALEKIRVNPSKNCDKV